MATTKKPKADPDPGNPLKNQLVRFQNEQQDVAVQHDAQGKPIREGNVATRDGSPVGVNFPADRTQGQTGRVDLTLNQRAALGDEQAKQVLQLQAEQGLTQNTPVNLPLNPLSTQQGTLPTPQPQTGSTGQINSPTSESTGSQALDKVVAANEVGLQTAKLASGLVDETSKEFIRAASMQVALGSLSELTLGAKTALNTPVEIAKYSKYIPEAVTPGTVTTAGKIASNVKNAGLFRQLLGATVTFFGVKEMITAVLDDPQSTAAYDRVYGKLSNDVVATQKAFEEETDPLLKQAYAEELDNILEIQREFNNPETWAGIKFKVPIAKQIAVSNILSKARQNADDVETRNAQRAIDKYKLVQIRAGQISRLGPEARDFLKRLSDNKKEELALAKGI